MTKTNYQVGDIYPDYKKLKQLPYGKTCRELGLNVGDLLVVITTDYCASTPGIIVEIIEDDDSCVPCFLYVENGRKFNYCLYLHKLAKLPVECSTNNVAPSRQAPKRQKSEMKLIQSAVYEQDGVRFQKDIITLRDVDCSMESYFTFKPETLKSFITKARTALARYNRLKEQGKI